MKQKPNAAGLRSGWTRLLQRRRGVGVGLFIMHKPQAVTTPTHPLKGGEPPFGSLNLQGDHEKAGRLETSGGEDVMDGCVILGDRNGVFKTTDLAKGWRAGGPGNLSFVRDGKFLAREENCVQFSICLCRMDLIMSESANKKYVAQQQQAAQPVTSCPK